MMAKILLVEDDWALRESLRDFLVSKHHIVIEASDGAQGFALAEKEKPHLIIMDVIMPGVYGTTAGRKLGETEETAKIPIIIMSGSIEGNAFPWIQTHPHFRFLKKPIDPIVLEKTIQELLPYGGYRP